MQITEDGYPVVTHDRDPSPAKCVDTAPAFAGDPEFPYVPNRTYIKDLTLAQVRTIDCGSLRQAQFPNQELHPGERMPVLSEVEVRRARMLDQVTIQSFDWGALMRMREVERRLPIVALTNGQQFLRAGLPCGKVTDPGYVPFTTRELVNAAHRRRMEVIPWTIDDPTTIESLIAIGVDGIITDVPDQLRTIMAAHGFKLPKAYR